MRKQIILVLGALLAPPGACAAGGDDPVLAKVMIDKLEWRDADGGDLWVWDADAWIGKDLDKLWLKTEGHSALLGSPGGLAP